MEVGGEVDFLRFHVLNPNFFLPILSA